MIFIKAFMIISSLAAALMCSSSSTSSVFAEPMDPNYSPENCKKEDKYGYVTCCWKKDGQTYCQACKTDGKTIQCGKVQGPIGFIPGQSGPVFQRDDGILEQPSTTNNPPIKSDNPFPNDDDKVLDEQQSNPNSPQSDQRIPLGNAGVLEQLGDSSNNQNGESDDSVSSDNSGLFNVVPQNSQP